MSEHDLFALADRVDAITAPDRELDADVAEQMYGWAPFAVGPDFEGSNACWVLTPGGMKLEGYAYPPRGLLPRYYHVDRFTRDTIDPALPKDLVRKALAAQIRDVARRRAQTPISPEAVAAIKALTIAQRDWLCSARPLPHNPLYGTRLYRYRPNNQRNRLGSALALMRRGLVERRAADPDDIGGPDAWEMPGPKMGFVRLTQLGAAVQLHLRGQRAATRNNQKGTGHASVS